MINRNGGWRREDNVERDVKAGMIELSLLIGLGDSQCGLPG
jgi:hypothetical protein